MKYRHRGKPVFYSSLVQPPWQKPGFFFPLNCFTLRTSSCVREWIHICSKVTESFLSLRKKMSGTFRKECIKHQVCILGILSFWKGLTAKNRQLYWRLLGGLLWKMLTKVKPRTGLLNPCKFLLHLQEQRCGSLNFILKLSLGTIISHVLIMPVDLWDLIWQHRFVPFVIENWFFYSWL